jgi:hypothetical protein
MDRPHSIRVGDLIFHLHHSQQGISLPLGCFYTSETAHADKEYPSRKRAGMGAIRLQLYPADNWYLREWSNRSTVWKRIMG